MNIVIDASILSESLALRSCPSLSAASVIPLFQFDHNDRINDSILSAPTELRSRLSPSFDNSAIALFKLVDNYGINIVFVIAPATVHPLQLEGIASHYLRVVLLLLAVFPVAPSA